MNERLDTDRTPPGDDPSGGVRASGGTVETSARGERPGDWQVELWPNRSLSRAGLRGFLLLLGLCFGVFFAMTWAAPGSDVSPTGLARVLGVVLLFITGVFALVCLAFRANNRAGLYRERLRFEAGNLLVEAERPGRPGRSWRFQPHWTRVMTRTTRETENQLILRQSTRAVAIGDFLTPEERADLAEEIRHALRRYNGALA